MRNIDSLSEPEILYKTRNTILDLLMGLRSSDASRLDGELGRIVGRCIFSLTAFLNLLDDDLSSLVGSNAQRSPYDDGHLKIDFGGKTVSIDGELVYLPPREYGVLECLALHPNQTLSSTQILGWVWGLEYAEHAELYPSYVRLYVLKVRRKIEPDPSNPKYIITNRGFGYYFKPKN